MSIIVEHINHIYSKGQPDETYALRDVSFSIEDGEFAGIIGHTGSGKSTLIQHLNGLLRPDSGKITIDGFEITAKDALLRDVRRKVGLVFQYPEYQLFEETVEKDIAFGPENAGLSDGEISQRVKEAMELVDLDYATFAQRSPFDLSGGQKRRAAIAGVLAMHPSVLILDEPTAGLDPKAHKEILDMLVRIHKQHKITIILVSHNMDDIAALCGKVLVMDGGRLVLSGSVREIFSHTELLRETGLDLPSAAQMAQKLRDGGMNIKEDILFYDELADAVAERVRGADQKTDMNQKAEEVAERVRGADNRSENGAKQC